MQLETIGVGAQNDYAQLALQRAGETENEYKTYLDNLAIDFSLKQRNMAELKWDKEGCEKGGGIGYYDTFKKKVSKKDISVNMLRIKFAEFWHEIIEK